MSISISLLTTDCALVASDGRLTSGVEINNSMAVKSAMPISDTFDKTFSFFESRLIGTVTGTMEFDGATIINHIESILKNGCYYENSIELTVECLNLKLKEKLEQISLNEILFKYRKIDMTLIGSSSGKNNDFNLYNLCFAPDSSNDNIIVIEEKLTPIKNKVAWQLFGDDSARKAVKEFLDSELAKIKVATEKNLRSLLYKAIRHGIKHSSNSPFGNEKSCGGKVFVKSMKSQYMVK
jgi:hypothetical protein